MFTFAPAQILWVGRGGGLGSMLRFGTQQVVQRALTPSAFPRGTLAVNLLGCLAVGLVVALQQFGGLLAVAAGYGVGHWI